MTADLHIIELPEVDSTNAYALKLLQDNRPPEGTIISCAHQTNGRGIDTNQWESEPEKNLTLSFILYPSFLQAADQFQLSQAISLAVREIVAAKISSAEVTIKWPNDIYIGDKKVAGILIQNSIMGTSLDYSVVGIGLNVNQTKFLSNAPNPVSLSMMTGITYELSTIRMELISSVSKFYELIRQGLSGQLNSIYLSRLFRIGQWHEYAVKGCKINAMIKGITSFGQLQLESANGTIRICDLKEVQYIL